MSFTGLNNMRLFLGCSAADKLAQGDDSTLLNFSLKRKMERQSSITGGYWQRFSGFLRKCMFSVLSAGPVPGHIAFIMDGNRRYAKRQNLPVGEGHRAGFYSLLWILGYCYELGVRYVTVYAFSIDNFNRQPSEVQSLMDLMLEKIEELLKEESIVNQYGIRLCFIGNLRLLSENVREAVERAMKVTSKNDKVVLLICVAYTSTDEIVHAIEESCEDKLSWSCAVKERNGSTDHTGCKPPGDRECGAVIKMVDVERHMYTAVAPDPDILVRSSGETRLSNFLLWQSANSQLYCPRALWPDLGLWHLVWAVLSYQRSYSYLIESTVVKPQRTEEIPRDHAWILQSKTEPNQERFLIREGMPAKIRSIHYTLREE